jgi:hypothetical protein
VPTLRACEVYNLIAQAPSDRSHILQAGNYKDISKLTGTFYFYSNAVEYVLELGRSLAYFYRMGCNPIYAVFHLMTIAINNCNEEIFLHSCL